MRSSLPSSVVWFLADATMLLHTCLGSCPLSAFSTCTVPSDAMCLWTHVTLAESWQSCHTITIEGTLELEGCADCRFRADTFTVTETGTLKCMETQTDCPIDIMADNIEIGGKLLGGSLRLSARNDLALLSNGLIDVSAMSSSRRLWVREYGLGCQSNFNFNGSYPTNNSGSGGRVMLEACGTLTLDGLVRADGSKPDFSGYAYGAGGSVLMLGSVVSGSGQVSATGSDGQGEVHGLDRRRRVYDGGTGGHVAIHAHKWLNADALSIEVSGGQMRHEAQDHTYRTTCEYGRFYIGSLDSPLQQLQFPWKEDANTADARYECSASVAVGLIRPCPVAELFYKSQSIASPALPGGSFATVPCPTGFVGYITVQCASDGVAEIVETSSTCRSTCQAADRL